MPIHFGVEFNFAAMPGGASDRYYYDDHGRTLGLLDAQLSLEPMDRIGLVDEWLGVDAALETSVPAGMWAMPIQTVSQSESGLNSSIKLRRRSRTGNSPPRPMASGR